MATSRPIISGAESIGNPLDERDYADLERRWINREWAVAARLRSVDHFDGKELVGGRNGISDYSGVVIPYFLPGFQHEITYRLRRHNPEIDARTGKPKGKYLSASQDRNHLYYPPFTQPEELRDLSLPIIIVEGEFKGIAMRRLSMYENHGKPRFLVVGVSGVWNWRGTTEVKTNENGVRVPVKGAIHELAQILWPGRNVIIMFDSDAVRKPEVRRARHALDLELRSRGANIGFVTWDPDLGKGADDWVANVGPYEVLAAIAKVEYNTSSGWKAKLLCTNTGKPKPLLENARIALENVPELAGIQLNEFSGEVHMPTTIPWRKKAGRVVDVDIIELVAWLQRNGIDIGKDAAWDAIQMVASRCPFHPVRDYLESLQWDGEPRVDAWLTTYLGAKPEGDAAVNYTAAIGRCWLISAVARIFQPGCKADCMLILEGEQGILKSSAAGVLGGEWFVAQMPNLNTKDASAQVRTGWIFELSELASMLKSNVEEVKDFLSRQTEVFRPPYGRTPIHVERQCVFIGTINPGGTETYLRDPTGNRRFWPVRCGTIDLLALKRDRDQLWAEAVDLYQSGARWWLTERSTIAAAAMEQARRFDEDVWTSPIEKFLEGRDEVSVHEVLGRTLNVATDRQGQREQNRVAAVLKRLGFDKVHPYRDGKRVYLYARRAK
jgi:predicted P-loop ATPase